MLYNLEGHFTSCLRFSLWQGLYFKRAKGHLHIICIHGNLGQNTRVSELTPDLDLNNQHLLGKLVGRQLWANRHVVEGEGIRVKCYSE